MRRPTDAPRTTVARTTGTPRSIARTAQDVPSALVNAFSYDDKVLLERHLPGRELAVSMIEQDGEAVRADADFADRRSVVAAWLQADGPFSCETE